MTVDTRARAYLRELQAQDEALAAELAELEELARRADAVRARSRRVAAFLERLPAEREARRLAAEAAERQAAEARRAADAARRALAPAEESRDEARRREARARLQSADDRSAVAGRLLAEARSALAALDQEATAAEAEVPGLEARAGEIASELRGRPKLAPDAGRPPPEGLAGIEEWGGAIRAALFVARSSLAAERGAVVRQANELGSALLGEPLGAVGTAVLVRRVERELGD